MEELVWFGKALMFIWSRLFTRETSVVFFGALVFLYLFNVHKYQRLMREVRERDPQVRRKEIRYRLYVENMEGHIDQLILWGFLFPPGLVWVVGKLGHQFSEGVTMILSAYFPLGILFAGCVQDFSDGLFPGGPRAVSGGG